MIICIIVVIIIYLILSNYVLEPFEETTKLNFDNKLKLLNSLLVMHHLFEYHNIWYVIAFGTLLGAVRHRGLIPWDDDADVLVYYKDMDKIMSLADKFKQAGLRLEKTWKLIKIYISDTLFVDLFLIESDDKNNIVRCETTKNKCVYPSKDVTWWWELVGFPKKLIMERRKFEFDGIYLWGPLRAHELLRFWYGDKFLTTCKTHYLDHITGNAVTPKDIPCGELPSPQFPN